MMRYPFPAIDSWDDIWAVLDWCQMRKLDVYIRSQHHLAATPKSIFLMRRVFEETQRLNLTLDVRKYEIVFENDDCAIEYRLRFL